MFAKVVCFPLRVSVVLAAVLLAVCGDQTPDDRPATVPVSGKVTLDGQPVAGATVIFVNTEQAMSGGSTGSYSSVGKTDENGVYRLTTFESGDGAVPGTYAVTITKYATAASGTSSGSGGSETGEGESLDGSSYVPPEGRAGESESPRNELPEKYSNPTTSMLEATVTEDGENDIPFDLTSS